MTIATTPAALGLPSATAALLTSSGFNLAGCISAEDYDDVKLAWMNSLGD